MAEKRARRPGPSPTWSRYAAPAAFLLAATVAVLAVRSALHEGARRSTTTTPPAAATSAPERTARTTTARTAPPASTAKTYVVQAGDTFGSIAAKTGTTVAELERLNPGVASTSLHVGQKLRVR